MKKQTTVTCCFPHWKRNTKYLLCCLMHNQQSCKHSDKRVLWVQASSWADQKARSSQFSRCAVAQDICLHPTSFFAVFLPSPAIAATGYFCLSFFLVLACLPPSMSMTSPLPWHVFSLHSCHLLVSSFLFTREGWPCLRLSPLPGSKERGPGPPGPLQRASFPS